MMDCTNCGAPLPVKSNLCNHCGSLNDVDLRAVRAPTVKGPHSDRDCPHCHCKMGSVDLRIGDGFFIEQCDRCMGIFFDPDELETLLDQSVSKVFEADLERMSVLSEEESPDFTRVKYVKCPVCREIMNRRNYGARSGVIVDVCKPHGVWLDGGELRRLLNWVKAGGLLHDQAKKERDKKLEQRKKRAREIEERVEDSIHGGYRGFHSTPERDYLGVPSVLRLILDLLG